MEALLDQQRGTGKIMFCCLEMSAPSSPQPKEIAHDGNTHAHEMGERIDGGKYI